MEHKKDLGKLFKDRLAQVEAEPNTRLWNSIEKTLREKRRKKRGFFWLWSGLLVLSGILFTTFYLNQQDSGPDLSPKTETTTTQDSPRGTNKKPKEKKAIDDVPTVSYDDHGSTAVDGQEKKEGNATYSEDAEPASSSSVRHQNNTKTGTSSPKEKMAAGKGRLGFDKDGISKKKKSQMPDRLPAIDGANEGQDLLHHKNELVDNKEQEREALAENRKKDSIGTLSKPIRKPKEKSETEIIKKAKDDSKKMLISVRGGPFYYDYISSGNVFGNDLVSGALNGNIALAYGGLLNIPLSEKTTFRLGFSVLNTRTTIKNASSTLSDSGNAAIFTSDVIARNGNTIPTALLQSVNNGDFFTIEQKSSYTELPFEFTYTFSDNKLQLDAIGGISFQLLGKNTIAVENSTGKVLLGTANHLKKVSFTPNIGLGIRYKLSNRVRLDLEPTVRYQFNAFEKEYKNRKPFILGAYTGITIKL